MEAKALCEQMKSKAEKDRRDINVLAKTKEYLEGSVKDLDKNLRETLQKRMTDS